MAKQSAETAEASLSGEQSGTTPSTSMNAPTQDILLQNRKVLNWFGIADLSSPIHTDNPRLNLGAKVRRILQTRKKIRK